MNWRQRYAFFATLLGVAASAALLAPALASAATIGMPQNNLGLVGYWTMGGANTHWNTGTEDDSSGNGNTGHLVNMSTTTSPCRGRLGRR